MTNPVYYYLSGTPAKIEERLLDPVRLADKWWVQAWHPHSPLKFDNPLVVVFERIGKTVASAFLYLLSIPLKSMAALIHTIYRTPIPQTHFEERKKYWDKIIVSTDDAKDTIVKELIRANISDTKYTKIFWDVAFKEEWILKMGYFADDMRFPDKRGLITNKPSDGPYLFVRQGGLSAQFQPCENKEVTDANIQEGFKKRLVDNEFKGFFSKEIISKCDFLLAINPSCQWDINNSLNEPAVRRRIEACVK